jgi:phosphoribosylformimino-5-aminoimidazole carboxamide ribotide isomerase
MDGEVVHARRGHRDAYRPIRSGLATGADPRVIAGALLALAPFRRLYVADLDAIRGQGDNDAAVAALAAAHPDVELLVDRGAIRSGARARPGTPVLGTESFSDAQALTRALNASPAVLSLDHDADGPIGPTTIHADAALWPSRVILMTLARVGAAEGPDFAHLEATQARAGHRLIYAAGGVRDAADLHALARLGAAGALVASALHDGRLTASDLAAALQGSPRTPPRQ